MGTNCASVFADLFLYSYEADFMQGLLKKNGNEKKLALSFDFTFRDIDDVLTLNNSRGGDFVDRIYIYIAFSFKLRIPQIQIGLLHTLTYSSKLTLRDG
jgi:hypothetical protein